MVYVRIIPHFPSLCSFRNLPLKSIRIFSSIPTSEVAYKFPRKIIIKIFQTFVVNVSKMFLTCLSKNFFNLSEIS